MYVVFISRHRCPLQVLRSIAQLPQFRPSLFSDFLNSLLNIIMQTVRVYIGQYSPIDTFLTISSFKADLATFLKSGHVRGAALDVHEQEPYEGNIMNPLSQCPNVIHTPHASWFSDSSCKELRVNAAKEVRRAILNRFPNDLLNCVNKDQLLANASFLSISALSFNGLPQMSQMGAFPYGNPLLAMGGMNLNPLLMTPNSAALAQFANPAAALSTLAAQTSQAAVVNVGSPALNATPSPNATSGKLASPQNGGITPPSPSNAEVGTFFKKKVTMIQYNLNLPGATGASGDEIRPKTEKEELVEINGQGENGLNGANNDE
uniref:2-Hacid_dh_C domain-containing protein n=1 Tax=Angiostrongylus cantonensis TaxID=6313 RepID=A0A0K0D0M2_ANGCA